ncbi:hypothetical protein JHK82_051190 [Glycine max]|nr:hypothetical protein JHK82_051190 [Glycine max]
MAFPVISSDYCAPYAINLQINTKTGFTYDANNACRFYIEDKLFTLHKRRVLCDNQGNPIVTLYKKRGRIGGGGSGNNVSNDGGCCVVDDGCSGSASDRCNIVGNDYGGVNNGNGDIDGGGGDNNASDDGDGGRGQGEFHDLAGWTESILFKENKRGDLNSKIPSDFREMNACSLSSRVVRSHSQMLSMSHYLLALRQMSVVQIEHSETTKRGKPKFGGLKDPWLGTIDRKLKCETCRGSMAS